MRKMYLNADIAKFTLEDLETMGIRLTGIPGGYRAETETRAEQGKTAVEAIANLLVAAEIEIEEDRQQKQLPMKIHNLEQKVETLSAEIRALRARIEKLEYPMRPL
jgi:uncharacterized protein YceH (UPF0502 family)